MSALSQKVLVVCLAAILLAGEPVRADGQPARTADPSLEGDVADLGRMLRHKDPTNAGTASRFLVFAPSIGSKPSTGLNGGFSSNLAFFLGDPSTTHISSITGGLKVSQKKQTLRGVRFAR